MTDNYSRQAPYVNNPNVHPDAPSGGGGRGRFKTARTPGSLGRTYPAKTTASKNQKAPNAVLELNIVGQWNFQNPDEKKKARDSGVLGPDTDVLVSVVKKKSKNSPILVSSVWGLLHAIVQNSKKGTITRVNVFTHGNRTQVAFKGTLRLPSLKGLPAEVLFTDKSEDQLGMEALDRLDGSLFPINKEEKHTLKDVRERFGKNAEIVLYACYSGVDLELVERIANTLQVVVFGFREKIAYCFDDKKDAGISLGIGSCDNAVADFHDLIKLGIRTKLGIKKTPGRDPLEQ